MGLVLFESQYPVLEGRSGKVTVNSFTIFIVKKLQLEHGTLKIHNHGLFFQKRKERSIYTKIVNMFT